MFKDHMPAVGQGAQVAIHRITAKEEGQLTTKTRLALNEPLDTELEKGDTAWQRFVY
ncbi:unnamed protein product [Heligmosomoides polygyrus]|uniref:Uncharacterized protein n=1 Tax=Heligmosomoides polygyrus TaxID=6339 RepID=A0A3P8B2J8_HELPZ|nr:unnamed protein product [Heligmosomoides polygyrus]